MLLKPLGLELLGGILGTSDDGLAERNVLSLICQLSHHCLGPHWTTGSARQASVPASLTATRSAPGTGPDILETVTHM